MFYKKPAGSTSTRTATDRFPPAQFGAARANPYMHIVNASVLASTFIPYRFFIFFIGAGTEPANSFGEQNNPLAQREALDAQAAAQAAGDLEAQTVDEDFLETLEYGMPPASGIGVGLDRLAMILTGAPNIREVLAFPRLREKK